MKTLLKEPLLHFLVLGAALFLLSEWRGTGGSGSRRIVVTPSQIAHLATGFEGTWQRAPTADELQGLIQDWVREEAAYREAQALGLDRDDTIVRRRLRQKLEFLTEDVVEAVEPTEAELQAYLDSHAADFRLEPRVSFRQVYLSRDRRGASAEADARRILSRLERGGPAAPIDGLGDPLVLPQEFELPTRAEIARWFGEAFAARLLELDAGRWSGPIESSYGLHLVEVGERTEGRMPVLDEVRGDVARDWAAARRRETTDEYYRQLLARYDVVVEPADAATSSPAGSP